MDTRLGHSATLSLAVCGLLLVAIGVDKVRAHDPAWEPATHFGDGQWAVGVDIEEGVYVQDAEAAPDCAISTENTGGIDLVPDQPADGRMAIALTLGDVVYTQACGVWRKP